MICKTTKKFKILNLKDNGHKQFTYMNIIPFSQKNISKVGFKLGFYRETFIEEVYIEVEILNN